MEFYLDNQLGRRSFAAQLGSIVRFDKGLPIFVCIGSDRVVGDMIAPLVAERLVREHRIRAYVYGRLHNPITCSNLVEAMKYITATHTGQQVIIIDASLGKMSEIGKVKLLQSGCIPAGGFGKSARVYGDVSILPVVSTAGISDKTFLTCAKFNTILQLSRDIADCVALAMRIAWEIKGDMPAALNA